MERSWILIIEEEGIDLKKIPKVLSLFEDCGDIRKSSQEIVVIFNVLKNQQDGEVVDSKYRDFSQAICLLQEERGQ
jgi:hypothetical protein